MKQLYQIVPTLPPAIDGLGDYAFNLARQLRQDWNIETHFIIGDPSWNLRRDVVRNALRDVVPRSLRDREFPEPQIIEEFPISSVSQRTTNALPSVLPQNFPLLLHYSGYGYALRGCPRWLVAGLERWRKQNQTPLVTMFHEVYPYNFGPPWTSSFWLSPWQKQLATRLLKLSDRVLTSRENYAKLLNQLSKGLHADISTFPVFSNISEPATLIPWEHRERIAIAFGHRNMRSRLYQNLLPQTIQICQTLGVEAIYDIGKPTEMNLSAITEIKIIEMGILEGSEVSQWMKKAIAGFLSFPPPQYLGKSGIFAAYCAHNLLPILFESSPVVVDGLEAGKHYWSFDAKIEELSLEAGRAIANNAHLWYQSHSLPILAQIVKRSIYSSG
ncbi:MAG: glycosyltransferase family 1 protein [Cyanobacteriota bacterium]|nr:glycosyltransferase family 1 protein [Cyanobacteriota bacterium]